MRADGAGYIRTYHVDEHVDALLADERAVGRLEYIFHFVQTAVAAQVGQQIEFCRPFDGDDGGEESKEKPARLDTEDGKHQTADADRKDDREEAA